MKVKINTEIDLACLFDAAHSQKEIHAMLEYLVPHASNETLLNEVWKRGIDTEFIRFVYQYVGIRDVQRIKNYAESIIKDWCKENNVENVDEYL
jgi:hypothetical protein